jgi:hypothetical protein
MRRLVSLGRSAEALDDATRLAAMARHLSSDGTLTARLFSGDILEMTIAQVAELLPDVPVDVVRSFDAKWKAKAPLGSYADAVLCEATVARPVFAAAAEEDPEKVVGPKGYLIWNLDFLVDEPKAERDRRKKAIRAIWLDPMRRSAAVDAALTLEREEATILRLPEDQFGARAASFKKRIDAEPWGPALVPAVEYLHGRERREAVALALLDAAIAVTLDGKEALSRIKDPAGNGPFEYTPTETGYVLTSKLERGRGIFGGYQ